MTSRINTPKSFAAAFLAAALAVSACGGSEERPKSDPNPRPSETTTFTGRLTAAPGGPSDVNLAILWFPQSITGEDELPEPLPGEGELEEPACTGEIGEAETIREAVSTIAWASQSAQASASNGGAFSLSMTGAPPQAVRYDLTEIGGSGFLSAGVVVAYDDTNGNGAFDQGRPGVAGDEILGVSAEGDAATLLVYLAGSIPEGAMEGLSGTIPQGYSLLVLDPQTGFFTVQPVSTAIQLAVSPAESEDAGLMRMYYACSEVEMTLTIGGVPPASAELQCSEAGDSYYWQTEPVRAPCSMGVSYGFGCLEEGQSPGESWPCQ